MEHIIIDTDAGIDDAEAIMLALRHPATRVAAITTVTGNVHIDQVNRNVATILQQMQQTVPVYAGAPLPLVEPWQGAAEVHQEDGMGDWDERPPCEVVLQPEHAAVALVRLAREHPGQLTLVALGPLTNIALALRLNPAFAQQIKRFVFMGGSANAMGNTARMAAEFNTGADPEAAYIALHSFAEATMVGWDTTLAHPMSWADYERLSAVATPAGRFFHGITHKFMAARRELLKDFGHFIPDPLAMAVALEPGCILAQETRYVTVELSGQHARGQTIANYTWRIVGQPNVHLVRQIDMAGVIALYDQALGA